MNRRPIVIFSAILSGLYLLNPGFGIFDLIPDNLPIVGNLDEGAAAYVLFSAMAYLMGKDFGLFSPKAGPERKETIDLGQEDLNG